MALSGVPIALILAHMETVAWEVSGHSLNFPAFLKVGITNTLVFQATLSVRNFHYLTSPPTLSISATSPSMPPSEMSPISLLDVNAQMSELLRTSWR